MEREVVLLMGNINGLEDQIRRKKAQLVVLRDSLGIQKQWLFSPMARAIAIRIDPGPFEDGRFTNEADAYEN